MTVMLLLSIIPEKKVNSGQGRGSGTVSQLHKGAPHMQCEQEVMVKQLLNLMWQSNLNVEG